MSIYTQNSLGYLGFFVNFIFSQHLFSTFNNNFAEAKGLRGLASSPTTTNSPSATPTATPSPSSTPVSKIFSAPVNYNTGVTPAGIAKGDFNKDGSLDIAVASSNSNAVSVFIGKGNGAFNAAVNYGVTYRPYGITVSDLDKDGNLDIAVICQDAAFIAILFGKGDGTFFTAQTFPVASYGTSIVAGDFDGDNYPDIAALSLSNSASILKNNGNRTFQLYNSVNIAGTQLREIRTGDFNHDGFLDLASVSFNDRSLIISMGNGNCTFQPQKNYTTGNMSPLGLTINDFKGDSHLDIGMSSANSTITGVAMVFLNYGNGSFASFTQYNAHYQSQKIDSMDVTGDGIVDLVVTNLNSNDISVLPGVGNGDFFTSQNYTVRGSGAFDITLGDINNDGRIDAITTNSGSHTISVLINALTFPVSSSPSPSIKITPSTSPSSTTTKSVTNSVTPSITSTATSTITSTASITNTKTNTPTPTPTPSITPSASSAPVFPIKQVVYFSSSNEAFALNKFGSQTLASSPLRSDPSNFSNSSASNFSCQDAGNFQGSGNSYLIAKPTNSNNTGTVNIFNTNSALKIGGGISLQYFSTDKSANAIVINGNAQGDLLGFSTSSIDINDDHLTDILMSSPGANNKIGKVQLFLGNNLSILSSNGCFGFTFSGSYYGSLLGFSTTMIADVTNNNLNKIVIGAPGTSHGIGAITIIYNIKSCFDHSQSTPKSLSIDQGYTIFATSSTGLAYFGSSVAGGDFDGNGYIDLLVGAPGYNNGRGAFYFLPGGEKGLGLTADLVAPYQVTSSFGGTLIQGLNSKEYAGFTVYNIGDINGNGRDDAAISAPGSNKIYLVEWDTNPKISAAISNINRDNTGTLCYIESVGDKNGDGYNDFTVSSSFATFLIFGNSNISAINLDVSSLPSTQGIVLSEHSPNIDCEFRLSLLGLEI